MAEFENPFVDPEAQNLFHDPSVQQATRPSSKTQGLSDFNPFAAEQQQFVGQNYGSQAATTPAKLQPSSQTSAAASQWKAEELQQKQQELDQRAAELDRREQDMQHGMEFQERRNNFPPLPGWFPFKPCFYQDFDVEIPVEFQHLVRNVYRLWQVYVGALLINVLGALTYWIASSVNGIDNQSPTTFGMSLVCAVLYTPCSFVCWYRPVYNAFKSDSSFNFFLFFFIFFFQSIYSIVQCLGIDGWGTVGIITSSYMFSSGYGGAIFAGIVMLIIGLMFGVLAALDIFMLLRIHRVYGSTGASFAKAQQELAQGVLSNKSVQQTAGNMASSAARATVAGAAR